MLGAEGTGGGVCRVLHTLCSSGKEEPEKWPKSTVFMVACVIELGVEGCLNSKSRALSLKLHRLLLGLCSATIVVRSHDFISINFEEFAEGGNSLLAY